MTTLPISPTAKKRMRTSPDHLDLSSKAVSPPHSSASSVSAASSFRNVSACNRCRLRKNRCDQRLPACSACEKAHVKCVGYDPITKREIPRSFVFYLESRVSYLESLLQANGISFKPPEDFATTPRSNNTAASVNNGGAYKQPAANPTSTGEVVVHDERNKVDRLLSHASRVAVQGASDSRFLGSTSGISFARVVFAAVKSSVSGAPSERGGIRPSKPLGANSGGGTTSMRDSFFGLHTKPTIKPAQFPSKELGEKLVSLYFEHANPQIPILHRPEFMAMFENAYASDERSRSARESYMLNIVFAIGAGIIVGKSSEEDAQTDQGGSGSAGSPESEPSVKKRKIVEEQCQPEEYHASAIVHLESFLASSAALERPDGIGGSLEELQAVLLLAGFALLRPVAPGLWYIVGVALRLGVDLGLHSEDWSDSDRNLSEDHRNPEGDLLAEPNGTAKSKSEKGRRQYICDFRRRLWWCVYSFDRLVSTCVGRPFGITDQVITTEFPTLLNDKYITPKGFLKSPAAAEKPSYKLVAYHYFRLRLLQSEILQVLQHRQASQARERGVNQDNPYMHTQLPSPFLKNFDYSFRHWRQDIDRRLWEWKETAPTQQDAGVQFSPLFLELNYWQAVIMLYRQSLTVPAVLADELRATNEDIQSPSMVQIEEREDEETVFLKVAEAGQKVLKLYRQLHRIHLVNYTFLATHHLFMAGISFLYAIWHSPSVRSQLSLDDVDFTVLAATSVLDDLTKKCPPAEACRDAFVRMSKATIKMCLSTTGFGARGGFNSQPSRQSQMSSTDRKSPEHIPASLNPNAPYFYNNHRQPVEHQQNRRPAFDYDLRNLFSDEETASTPLGRFNNRNSMPLSSRSQPPSIHQQLSHLKSEAPSPSSQYASFQPLTTSALNSPSLSAPHHLSSPSAHFGNLSQTNPSFNDNILNTNNNPPPSSSTYSNTFGTNIPAQSPYNAMVSPFSDLDFLDSMQLGNHDGNGDASGGMNDFGLDMGMGWDGSLPGLGGGEEGGLDLFDGFFFGGNMGGMGG
ncbi:hypothetical protein EG327_007914 [Venturia inaequalis]|uniref:Zn(2)-C6 fungal-type domain-containing protein n=1 Tax=Venturia inaequalis TaxID=5025 RepID=A0A8H3UWX1_VENIN|nr:hypothetical protein EG327_007914 [Venturia inaequalis]